MTFVPSNITTWFNTSSHTETYTGSNLLPSNASSYLNLTDAITGKPITEIVDAGTYYVKASPKDGYKWSGVFDKKTWEKTVTVTVFPRSVSVTLSKATEELTYNGKERKGYTLSGDISYVIFTEYRSFLSA